jgi:hypothetical protein
VQGSRRPDRDDREKRHDGGASAGGSDPGWPLVASLQGRSG